MQRSLARPKLRPLCSTRVATLARVDTLCIAVGRFAGHVPRATPRSRLSYKMSRGRNGPAAGKGRHAATGARIVPWRQPGDWLGATAAAGPLPPVPASVRLEDCQSGVSTPTHTVGFPGSPTVSLSFVPFGQFPVAHRPSVPCWLARGSRAVSTAACEARPSLDGLCPTAYSGQRVQCPSERASSLSPPSESQRRYPGPAARLSRIPGWSRLHYQPARAPDAPPGPPEADPPRRRVRPRPIPTQARASATGGFEHRPTSPARSGEARWKRSEDLFGIQQGGLA
jgi:hypothetical protein